MFAYFPKLFLNHEKTCFMFKKKEEIIKINYLRI